MDLKEFWAHYRHGFRPTILQSWEMGWYLWQQAKRARADVQTNQRGWLRLLIYVDGTMEWTQRCDTLDQARRAADAWARNNVSDTTTWQAVVPQRARVVPFPANFALPELEKGRV